MDNVARPVNSMNVSPLPHIICSEFPGQKQCFVKYHVNNTIYKSLDSGFGRNTVNREGKSVARVSVCFTESKVRSLPWWKWYFVIKLLPHVTGAPREWCHNECSVLVSAISRLNVRQWWLEIHVAQSMNNLHGPLCLVSTGLRQEWLRKEANRCPQACYLIHLLIKILFWWGFCLVSIHMGQNILALCSYSESSSHRPLSQTLSSILQSWSF